MPTAREIRESNREHALASQLDDELRERYDAGEIKITGENNGRAVIVDAFTGRWVKGSARPANANDAAQVGRETSFKRTNRFREAWQSVFGLAGEDGAIGFDALVEKLWWAVQGAPQLAECYHEGCNKKHLGVVKPDAKVLFQMAESLIGRMQQVEIGGTLDHLHQLLQVQPGDQEGVGFYAINPKGEDSPEERKRILIDEGVIDAEWFEEEAVKAPTMPPPPDPPTQ
jgi:hypothetical protein